jgi:glycosyltransferase involved in cell wall biosynthesis
MTGSIVSVVFNDVELDSRVRTIAGSLASHPGDVVILGIGSADEDSERALGPVTLRVLASPPRETSVSRALSRLADRLERWRARSGERRRRQMRPRRAAAKDARRALRRAREPAAAERAEAELAAAMRRVHAVQRRNGPARALEARLKRSERRLRRRAKRTQQRRLARSGVRAMTRNLIALRPRAIHANDADGLDVAVRAAGRLKRRGGRPAVVYDAHEWTLGRTAYRRPQPGLVSQVELERRAIGRADAVVTVSEPLAELLMERHSLPERPAVVHSAPPAGGNESGRGLRELAGIPPRDVLLVNVGWVAERRGAFDAVRALALLPDDTRLAFLGPCSSEVARRVEREAESAGLAGRVHLVAPVPPEAVVATIRDADLGLMPLHRNEQHRVAMPNKLFQYAQAGLPVICSDCEAPSEFVRAHGIGEIHEAGDPGALAAAVRRALGRREELDARLAAPEVIETVSWRAQERELIGVYRRLGVFED